MCEVSYSYRLPQKKPKSATVQVKVANS